MKRASGAGDVSHDPNAPILELEKLGIEIGSRPILEEVSFRIRRGERIAVVGPNGAGKSTLFKSVSGLIPPTSGLVKIAGQRPGKHICIAYLTQRSEVDCTFPVTVFDAVMMGRAGRIGLFKRAGRSDRTCVEDCLETVGLTAKCDALISTLSGGQLQRMFIARALAQEAEIMLMDEPYNGLDMPSIEQILQILDNLKAKEVTVLVSTHDLKAAAREYDRVILLNRKVYGIDTPESIFRPALLKEAFGDHLQLLGERDGVFVMADTWCGCEEEGHAQ